MRVPRGTPLARTWPLNIPDQAIAAFNALPRPFDACALEGLVELLRGSTEARLAVLVIRALDGVDSPLVTDALVAGLRSPWATVRTEAAEALHARPSKSVTPLLAHLLRTDSSWPTRRAALHYLAAHAPPNRLWFLSDLQALTPATAPQELAPAATDPHWRVRHALVQVLRRWDVLPLEWCGAPLTPLERARMVGVFHYLAPQSGFPTAANTPPEPSTPPFFDWDAAVLARNLAELGDEGRLAHLAFMPELLIHGDDRVQRLALRTLRQARRSDAWAACLALVDDPRTGSVVQWRELLRSLDGDDRSDLLAFLQTQPRTPAQEQWLTTAGSWCGPEVAWPDVSATHPHRRAGALTVEKAHELLANPMAETSWFVLSKAAHLAKVPIWTITPEDDPPVPLIVPDPSPLTLTPGALVTPRLLGPEEWLVTPLGVSGHYGLPVEGFVKAVEVGVNLLFWEPNYATLTSFSQRIPHAMRDGLYFVAGTFEATAKDIRRDCERALKMLHLERLSLFLLFWTRNWARLNDDVRRVVEDLQQEGKVRRYSLSTHDRTLAVEAINAGWNPVMVRHSAAHRKAETLIFPHAATKGTSLITFNNTCYGRLLQPMGDSQPPTAADCYRYALEQPHVSACWTAPTTMEQLDENLQALLNPELPEERRAALLAHGAKVYANDTLFTQDVRSR